MPGKRSPGGCPEQRAGSLPDKRPFVRAESGATMRSREFLPERSDGQNFPGGELVPGEEQNGPSSADLERDDVAGGPQSGRVSESGGTGEAEEATASGGIRNRWKRLTTR